MEELKEGRFYWIIPVYCPDIDNDWKQEKQPARYAGNELFNMLDSDIKWPAKWTGKEII